MPKKTEQNQALAVIEGIEDKIYVIGGQRVMLDSDLAEVYQVETRVLNQALKRNLGRFPPDFVFQLTPEETAGIRSQTVSASGPIRSQSVSASKRNIRYLPYAFTEHGAVMLSSVLNSPTALHKDLAKRVDQLSKIAVRHGHEFDVVWELLGTIMRDPKYLKGKIGFVNPKKGTKK